MSIKNYSNSIGDDALTAVNVSVLSENCRRCRQQWRCTAVPVGIPGAFISRRDSFLETPLSRTDDADVGPSRKRGRDNAAPNSHLTPRDSSTREPGIPDGLVHHPREGIERRWRVTVARLVPQNVLPCRKDQRLHRELPRTGILGSKNIVGGIRAWEEVQETRRSGMSVCKGKDPRNEAYDDIGACIVRGKIYNFVNSTSQGASIDISKIFLYPKYSRT
ncbi:hypothetical protein V1478_005825 [Vespula squamosa]|uniref:Uncharacterized protein n=1 Tax=Vespula squamosa TaxID=30214 RepID=A0ABD2BA08_VESSQ